MEDEIPNLPALKGPENASLFSTPDSPEESDVLRECK
jgi:hypothetical protein